MSSQRVVLSSVVVCADEITPPVLQYMQEIFGPLCTPHAVPASDHTFELTFVRSTPVRPEEQLVCRSVLEQHHVYIESVETF